MGPVLSGRPVDPRLIDRDRRGGRVGRRGAVGGDEADAPGRGAVEPGDQPADGVGSRHGPAGVGGGGAAEVFAGARPGRSWIRSRTGSASSCAADPRIQSQRLRELATRARLSGREVDLRRLSSARSGRGSWCRGRFSGRSIGRASWSSAICGSRASTIPVGHGQRRRGWVVTCEVCWSRAIAGTLVFSKEAPDILLGPRAEPRGGLGRCRRSWSGTARRRSPRAAARPRRSPRSAASSRSAG